MGKKKGGKVDVDKKLALLARKATKAEKVAQKRISKQLRIENEDDDDDDGNSVDENDIDDCSKINVVDNMDLVLIEKYIKMQRDSLQRQQSLDQQKTILLDTSGFPLPRANATLTVVTDNAGMGSKKSKKNVVTAFLFGGEYFDGVQTIVLDQLFQLEIRDGTIATWKQIITPVSPPPRCAHSAVYCNRNIYVFGGETTSNGSEEYRHYKDLWKYNLEDKTWTELASPGKRDKDTTAIVNYKLKSHERSRTGTTTSPIHTGMIPTPRSGHGAVVWKHYMILFGGFFEVAKMEPKFYNDLYIFDMKTELWLDIPHSKLTIRPEPRSRCLMVTIVENDTIIVQGGFSKVPKPTMLIPQIPTQQNTTDEFPTSEAKVHTDAWVLNMKPILESKQPVWERLISSIARGQWKDSANRSPVGRCGVSALSVGNNRIITIGGVIDKELHHHQMDSIFYNDLYILDVTKRKFFPYFVNHQQPKAPNNPTSELKRHDDEGDDEEKDYKIDNNTCLLIEEDSDSSEALIEKNKEKGWDVNRLLKSDILKFINKQMGFGKLNRTVNEDDTSDSDEEEEKDETKSDSSDEEEEYKEDDLEQLSEQSVTHERVPLNEPLPRIKALIFAHNFKLYVYGGLLEVGDREVTLDDLWCLDIRKKTWDCVYQGSMHQQVWKDIQNENDDESSTAGTITVNSKINSAPPSADEILKANETDFTEQEQAINTLEGEFSGKKEKKIKKERKKKKEDTENCQKVFEKSGNFDDDDVSDNRKNRKLELRHAIRDLVEQNGLDITRCSPQPDESFEVFYHRTIEYWNEAALLSLQKKQFVTDSSTIKQYSFDLATKRFHELQPVIAQIKTHMKELSLSKKEKITGEGEKKREKSSKNHM